MTSDRGPFSPSWGDCRLRTLVMWAFGALVTGTASTSELGHELDHPLVHPGGVTARGE